MNPSTPKKAVVTGGAGFIGSHLTRDLLAQGYEVHVVDNYSGGRIPGRESAAATYHEGDICDGALLRNVFEGAHYVFHTAALPRVQYSLQYPEKTNQANVTGTLSVLNAAKDAGVRRVVYSASSSAYGDQDIMPLVETMDAHPKSPYALQKYIGELYCRLYSEVFGLETVCLRYFNVYGKNADPHGAYALVIAKFIQQRIEGKDLTIAGDGTHTRDYTHVHDVVRANILSAEKPTVGKGEVMNIGGGKNRSVNEVAEAIGGPITYVEERLEPKDTLANTARAKELLGWETTISFEEGIAELKKEANLT
ncbi:NAD-dependent epimerase/dehydratase family protein [Patescibacteria group bacterium]|nr:NAD-dependent epimerase/dehydratase family protein [Patescibacteria group bacterium]